METKDEFPINEIFYSLSGEGLSSGLPTIFIRIAGCNFLHHPCIFCDTTYALEYQIDEILNIEEGSKGIMTSTQIIEAIKNYPCNRIIITGGEPLSHANINILFKKLTLRNYHLEIETNGSLPITKAFSGIWSIDMKTPSSGNVLYNLYSNLNKTRFCDQIKFVIGNEEDFKWAKETIDVYKPQGNILFQPIYGELDLKEAAFWIMRDLPHARLGIQLHKLIWGNEKGK